MTSINGTDPTSGQGKYRPDFSWFLLLCLGLCLISTSVYGADETPAHSAEKQPSKGG